MTDHADDHSGALPRVAAVTVLVSALVLGGGQGGIGDSLVQLAALALIAGLLLGRRLAPRDFVTPGHPAVLAWLFLLVPLLQLLPLPAAAWQAIDARAVLASQAASVSAVPETRISIAPLGAERALWSLLPGIALYLAALVLGARTRRLLCIVVAIVAFASLVLGLAQLAGGPDSPLRFYSNTNRTDAVGFFANRNHLASLFLVGIPVSLAGFVSAFAAGQRDEDASPRWRRVAAWSVLTVLLVLGLALTRSRSGVLLGAVGLVACLPMLLAIRRRRAAGRVLGVMATIGLVVLVQFGLFGLVQRLNTDPLGDHRWQIASLTAQGARDHAPLGAGLGTFRQVFGALDVDAPGDTIINHAHDDYLELWLEAGWPFLASAAVFALLFAWATARLWRAGGLAEDPWPHAAWAGLVLVLLHSALDYPLRTTALQACFGLLLATLMARAWPGRGPGAGALPDAAPRPALP